MRRVTKKGSLQLSINAIVILILAITLLGLGLGFIKKQFGTVTAKFEEASQEIENEIIDKIRSSGEILAFDKISLTAERGKPQQFYIGVKNTDGANTRCYKFEFTCSQSLSSDYCASPLVVGGGVASDDGGKAWFTTFKGMTIEALDVQVAPVKLQIADAPQDSYNLRIKLYQNQPVESTPPECADPTSVTQWSELASKQFFLEVR